MSIHQVHDQVQVSMDRLVLSQLRFHLVEPVHQSLQCIHELPREQESFFQLVLPEKQTSLSAPISSPPLATARGPPPTTTAPLPQQSLGTQVLDLPLHGFPTHCVPLVPDLPQQVVQLLSVIWKQGFFLQGPACPDGGVIDRLLPSQCLLELLATGDKTKLLQKA